MISVIRMEFVQRLRQPSSWASFGAILLFCGVIVFGLQESGRVHVNAPITMAQIAFFVTLLSGPLIAAIVGTGIYRDYETRSHELFFSTPMSRGTYYFGRFFGSYLAAALVYLAVPIALLIAPQLPGIAADHRGPVRLDSILLVYAVFCLVPLYVVGAIFFAIGALTRSLVGIHASGIVLFFVYLIGLGISSGLNSGTIAAWVDPYGFLAMDKLTDYWTPAQKNARPLPILGAFLESRILWLAIGSALLGLGRALFSPTVAGSAPRPTRRARRPEVVGPLPEPGGVSTMGLLGHLFVRQLRYICLGAPFLIVVALSVIFLWITANVEDGVGGAGLWPVTRRIAAQVESMAAPFVLLCALYAGETIWRDPLLRVASFVETSPVSRQTTLIARMLALATALAIALAVLGFGGILYQWAHHWTKLELPVYVSTLYGTIYPALLSFAALALLFHTLAPSKVVGHLLIVATLAIDALYNWLGWDHMLLNFGSAGESVYSDMNGWGPFARIIFARHLHWLLLSAALVLIASRLWPGAFRERLSIRWKQNHPSTIAVAATAFFLFAHLASGAWIAVNTLVWNRYHSQKTVARLKAKYEREYAPIWRDRPQPRVTAVEIAVDLFPERQQYDSRGTLTLVNKTDKPLSEIAVDLDAGLTVKSLELPGATRKLVDEDNGFRTFSLAKPLAPGESTTLKFSLAWDRKGFPNATPRVQIAANGTFLTSDHLAPRIGYQRDSELTTPDERKKQGLPEKPVERPEAIGRNYNYISGDSDRIAFRATVSTSADQTPLAPGDRSGERIENGRKVATFVMKTPIWNFWAVVSGRYAVVKDVWTAPGGKRVAVEVYAHPAHTKNAKSMIAGAKASLAFCSKNFAPYPNDFLRVVEFPAYGAYAQSFAGTIPYSEDAGFITDTDGESFDTPFYVTAHEVAHQWWAHQLLGADLRGSEILAESLSEYTALRVVEAKFGDDALEEFQKRAEDAYLKARSDARDPERPMLSARRQGYIHYQKGALVFGGIDLQLPAGALDGALKHLLKRFAGKEPPYPTAADLLETLRAAAPGDRLYQNYLTDTFEKITIHDIALKSAKTRRVGKKWKTTLSLTWKKYVADGNGDEVEVTPDDRVVVWLRGENSRDADRPTLFGHAKSSSPTLTFTTSFRPTLATIDGWRGRIERDRSDNETAVEEN